VLSNVILLGSFQSFKASTITVNDLLAVPHFVKPKVQVRNLPGELVWIELRRPIKLSSQNVGNVR